MSRLSQVAYSPPVVPQSTVAVAAVAPLMHVLFRQSPWSFIPGWSSAARVSPVPAVANPAVGALPVWGLIPSSPHSSAPEQLSSASVPLTAKLLLCCCCSSLGACAVSPVPMVIHAGVVVPRPRPTGTGLCDSFRWSPPGVGADHLVPALVHTGLVILRPRPADGGATAKRVAAVTNGRPSPRCPPLIYCNPPVTRVDPLIIHAGAVVRPPRPTGRRAATVRVATIADGLTSSCRAPFRRLLLLL